METIKKGKRKYHFIEMMACPGGCIGGGGQPRTFAKNLLEKRSKALYKQDRKLKIRTADENPALMKIYEEYLGKPLSKKAHNILHTKYRKRSF